MAKSIRALSRWKILQKIRVLLLIFKFLGETKSYKVPNQANKADGPTLGFVFQLKRCEWMLHHRLDHCHSEVISKYSVKTILTLSLFKFSSSAIIFSCLKDLTCTFSKFSDVRWVFGPSNLPSSFLSSRFSFSNFLSHLNTANFSRGTPHHPLLLEFLKSHLNFCLI